ncbi:MAG: hypothetical protein IT437_03450 [Phycisphaerales bacterium]|nr:hypothetical protein [Phycisphaerales bacterium]
MSRPSLALVVVLCAAAPLDAQEEVTFTVRFEHPVLTPGQVQRVSVWASFAPGVGAIVPWNTKPGTGEPGTVQGFSAAWFDIENISGASTGAYSNMAINPVMLGTPGIAFPSGTVGGIFARQFLAPTSQDNPILLWSADWATSSFAPREVTLRPVATALPYIFLNVGFSLPVNDLWTPISVENSFQVIPAPGVLVPLAAAAFFDRRRKPGSRPTARSEARVGGDGRASRLGPGGRAGRGPLNIGVDGGSGWGMLRYPPGPGVRPVR